MYCRAGRPGNVVSLVSGGERYVVDKLGKKLSVPIKELKVSHGKAAEAVQASVKRSNEKSRPDAKQRERK